MDGLVPTGRHTDPGGELSTAPGNPESANCPPSGGPRHSLPEALLRPVSSIFPRGLGGEGGGLSSCSSARRVSQVSMWAWAQTCARSHHCQETEHTRDRQLLKRRLRRQLESFSALVRDPGDCKRGLPMGGSPEAVSPLVLLVSPRKQGNWAGPDSGLSASQSLRRAQLTCAICLLK